MGRGKHCTPEKRAVIRKLISEGKTYAEISSLLDCFVKTDTKCYFVPSKRGKSWPKASDVTEVGCTPY